MTLGFVQSFPESTFFRVFLLLNYQQTDVSARQDLTHSEGGLAPLASPIAVARAGERQPVLEFVAPPEREVYFDIRTGPLAAGYYDLAIVVVPDPEQHQRELPYLTSRQSSTRASVYVGPDAEPPAIDYPLIDADPGEDSGFGDLLWFGIAPHKAGIKSEHVVHAGQDVTLVTNCQPFAANLADDLPGNTLVPVAFVAIMDDRDVPLNGEPYGLGAALPNRLRFFPARVAVPEIPGRYQVFFAQFPNPFVDMNEAEESGREFIGQSSPRFLLDAR